MVMRQLLVHGVLSFQTWHCCLMFLSSDTAMGCRSELEVEADGGCCLLQPRGLHGDIILWKPNEWEAGLGADGGLVPGRWGIYSGWGKTTLLAVLGWGKERSICSFSKEQRTGLLFFQSSCTSKT